MTAKGEGKTRFEYTNEFNAPGGMLGNAASRVVVGGTSQPTYDAARLAAEQRLVVITVNYRVGCFGFLDLREVPGGDTADTNCGLHDLALALAWAGENAAAFGGDPDRITVFGESAGAGLIMHMLTTPGVGGLVRGAIAQSPGIDFTQRADTSAAVATALLARVGVRTVRELRELPAVALLDAQTTVAADLLFDIGTMVFHPVVDDAFVTETPSVALAGGAAVDVALLLGYTTDELRLFLDPRPNRMDRAALCGWVRSYLTARMGRDPGGSVADTLIGRYLDAASATTRSRGADVWSALQTDATMRQPVIRVADSRDNRVAATFVAQFGWQSQSADGVDRGAFHADSLVGTVRQGTQRCVRRSGRVKAGSRQCTRCQAFGH